MKKIYFTILLLLFPIIGLNAVSSDDVHYEVEGLYMNSELELAGAIHVREIIQINGTYNGYIRDLIYANSKLNEFTGVQDDFYGSSIYNGTGIAINKVGIIKESDFDLEKFYVPYSAEYTEYIDGIVDAYDREEEGQYELTDITNGKSIKMYNETEDGITYFYIDYHIQNVIVEHNDCAEFYYNLIGDGFEDDIQTVNLLVWLPYPDEENLKIWAHGPLNGTGYKIEGSYGAILKVNNLYSNTPVDLRMTYNKSYFPININESKKSGVDALPMILKVEEERANTANKQRETAKNMLYLVLGADILYVIGLLGFTIYIYLKHDKELPSNFKHKYNREFIDDYGVEVVPYLMKKQIGENSFSASILNLIYKKNISVVKLKSKKNIYVLTKENEQNLNKSETEIMNLLFDNIGNGKEVNTNDIKDASKTNSKHIYDSYNSWKGHVQQEANEQEFYMNKTKVKLMFSLYSLVGFLLTYVSVSFGMANYIIAVVPMLSLFFLIYVWAFNKRTFKGNEHYKKWKAFENFLNDFGRFEEKDLPEIVLWERYLVYATVLGIAKKVSKDMKTKFENMNVNGNYNDVFIHYYLFNNIGNDITRDINSAVARSISVVETANSVSSSGGGFGGGFSSGGGFGGGGGGGKGF